MEVCITLLVARLISKGEGPLSMVYQLDLVLLNRQEVQGSLANRG